MPDPVPAPAPGPGTPDRPGAGRRPGWRVLAVAGTAGLLAALPLGGSASASTHARSAPVTVKKASRGSVGVILVTASGAALYRFTPDKPNKPTCTGGCASVWPPLLLPVGARPTHLANGISGVGTVKLADGRLQVTYHQLPLYRYAPDHGTSTSGQGVGGVWFVVHPKGAATTAAAATTTTASGGGY